MNDQTTVKRLRTYVPDGHFQFEDNLCVGVHLVDPTCLYHGQIRHLTPSDKKEVLRLISKLESLKYLDLRKNRLGPIPFLGLQKLEYVDLASNYMGEVPNWLHGLPLQYLNLGVNLIKTVPDWFSEFTEIKVLKLHKNNIRTVEPIRPCKQLTFLNLYFNWMKEIPNLVWSLKELEFFSWGVSGIESLPEEIGQWKKLKWLSMVANKITHMPDSFCELLELRGARLHKNHLESLPEDIGNLHKLEQLTLYKNNLKSLPPSFRKLNLKKLNLARNKFKTPPQIKATEWIIT